MVLPSGVETITGWQQLPLRNPPSLLISFPIRMVKSHYNLLGYAEPAKEGNKYTLKEPQEIVAMCTDRSVRCILGIGYKGS